MSKTAKFLLPIPLHRVPLTGYAGVTGRFEATLINGRALLLAIRVMERPFNSAWRPCGPFVSLLLSLNDCHATAVAVERRLLFDPPPAFRS